MLQFIEGGAIYNSINFSIDPNPSIGPNLTAYQTELKAYLCPSDPNVATLRDNINSYYACMGTTTLYQQGTTARPPYPAGINGNPTSQPFQGTGAFFYAISFGINSITDGTSNTIAYSEGLAGNGQNGNGSYYIGNGQMGITGSDGGAAATMDAYKAQASVLAALQTCANQWSQRSNSGNVTGRRGWRWAEGIPGFTMFNTIQTPNDTIYNVNNCRGGCNSGCNLDQSYSVRASSFHSGGVNACMADGSVRFFKNTISRNTWWALGTRANGEVIDANSQ
jgi:prepilin-type processing-associated H-X9-DG protein